MSQLIQQAYHRSVNSDLSHARVARHGNCFVVNLLAHVIVVRVATVTAFVSCGQFPRYNFLRERRTRGRFSPTFRRIVVSKSRSISHVANNGVSYREFLPRRSPHSSSHCDRWSRGRSRQRSRLHECSIAPSDRRWHHRVVHVTGEPLRQFRECILRFWGRRHRKLLPARRKRFRGTKVDGIARRTAKRINEQLLKGK